MDSNRREFLKNAMAIGVGCALGVGATISGSPDVFAQRRRTGASPGKNREAMFYKALPDGTLQCQLCPVGEKLKDGSYSLCRVRYAKDGKMFVTNYGKPAAMHLDPVEKNPLYHYKPGMKTLALATAGCNLACPACQNWEMSQRAVHQIKSYNLSPQQAVQYAKKNECSGFSYTFTEPTVFYEYCLDISKQGIKAGLKNFVVTGGYINPEPLKLMTKYIDAFCVSLKGTNDEMFGGGSRPRIYETVLNTLKIIKAEGKWLEVAILITPTKVDERQINSMIQWIRQNLGEFTPVHFSRFYPSFQLKNLPQTPVGVLENAMETAKKAGIKYAYIGNVPGHIGNNTFCHKCGKMLVQRVGFRVLKNNITGGRCAYCNTTIPGYW